MHKILKQRPLEKEILNVVFEKQLLMKIELEPGVEENGVWDNDNY